MKWKRGAIKIVVNHVGSIEIMLNYTGQQSLQPGFVHRDMQLPSLLGIILNRGIN